VYGHTHAASLKRIDGRVVINTGTWLKLQEKVPVVLGKLPPVHYPLFRPNYFRILEENGELVVYYETIEKEASSELTFLQRLLTLTKRKSKVIPIPKRP
jgi:hypothetical protein